MNRTSGLKAIGWVCGLGLISGTQAGVIDPSAVLGNLGFVEQGANRALAAPDYQWWYGCSPTAAGMMLAFYDRDGYGGRTYANILPGAVAAASTYPSTAGNWDYNFQSIIASQGHVADFYRGAYNTSGDDGAAPYHAFDSLADFMGTSQDSVSNTNGSTRFWYYSNGARLTARDAKNEGVWTSDGMYGIAEFFQYAGYGDGDISDDTTIFTQLVDTQFGGTAGFSFADFMAEIDAGRTLIVQVQGHSMLGYGYNNDGGAQTIYVHDTWNPGSIPCLGAGLMRA